MAPRAAAGNRGFSTGLLERLPERLTGTGASVAASAAEALGTAGTPRAVSYLVECLSGEPWLRCAAFRSLGEIGGEEALDAILSLGPREEGTVLFCAITVSSCLGLLRH